jgi:predicted transcriptional regulator
MRVHINLDDELVAELDQRVGRRRRSGFIAALVRRALDDERRWDDIEAGLGVLADTGHAWDDDPSAWVREQRRGDARRSG